MTVAGLKQTGIAKYRSVGSMGIQENLFNSDWKGEGVLRALTDFTEQKWRWPTRTGRQQFYIDHPWFLEAGESAAHPQREPEGRRRPSVPARLLPRALEHPQRVARHTR